MAVERRAAKHPAIVTLSGPDGSKGGKARSGSPLAGQRSASALLGAGTEPPVLAEVRDLILVARQTVAHGVNAALVMLYWKVGDRIRREILKEQRAEYGAEILPTLSAKSVPEFGQARKPGRGGFRARSCGGGNGAATI